MVIFWFICILKVQKPPGSGRGGSSPREVSVTGRQGYRLLYGHRVCHGVSPRVQLHLSLAFPSLAAGSSRGYNITHCPARGSPSIAFPPRGRGDLPQDTWPHHHTPSQNSGTGVAGLGQACSSTCTPTGSRGCQGVGQKLPCRSEGKRVQKRDASRSGALPCSQSGRTSACCHLCDEYVHQHLQKKIPFLSRLQAAVGVPGVLTVNYTPHCPISI